MQALVMTTSTILTTWVTCMDMKGMINEITSFVYIYFLLLCFILLFLSHISSLSHSPYIALVSLSSFLYLLISFSPHLLVFYPSHLPLLLPPPPPYFLFEFTLSQHTSPYLSSSISSSTSSSPSNYNSPSVSPPSPISSPLFCPLRPPHSPPHPPPLPPPPLLFLPFLVLFLFLCLISLYLSYFVSF